MNKRQKLLRELELEKLPEVWLQAFISKIQQECKTNLLRLDPKPKITTKVKTGRKVSFGNVTINKIHKKEIHDNYESSKKGIVKSALFIETYILRLLVYVDPKKWNKCGLECSTLDSLKFHLNHENLSLEIFVKDMKKIYSDLTKYNLSILGYKGSWIFKSMQPKLKLRVINNTQVWVDTGKKINVIPKLGSYLLQILNFDADRAAYGCIKDHEFASILIQKNWRRKRQLLVYTELARIKKLLLSFSSKLN